MVAKERKIKTIEIPLNTRIDEIQNIDHTKNRNSLLVGMQNIQPF